LLAAHAAGWRIEEVPVRYLPRIGRSKVTGTLPGYVRTVRDMRAVLAQWTATLASRDAQLVVLAKSPVPGRVKTRLTPPFTPTEAARLAEAALVDTLHAAAGAAVRRVLLVLDGEPATGSRLGSRCARSAGGRSTSGSRTPWSAPGKTSTLPVLLVGMDTPQVTADDLGHAVDRLLADGTDAVLGPATDGGYWALGCAARTSSTCGRCRCRRPTTGRRQLDRLQACDLRVRLLKTRRGRRPRSRRGPRRRRGTRYRVHGRAGQALGRCRVMGALYSGALRDGRRLEAVYPDGTGWPCPSSPGAVRCSPATAPCSTAAPERPSTSAVARAGSPLPSAGRVCPRSASTSTKTPYASPGQPAPRAPLLGLRQRALAGRWDTVLLADGNIGIGGLPVVLLRRVAALLVAHRPRPGRG
jgi:glycosyltransferase A (GT-A) superfamily protein (DUF2064 family)